MRSRRGLTETRRQPRKFALVIEFAVMPAPLPEFDSAAILAARASPRSVLDVGRPVSFFSEREYSVGGTIDDVATIFLTNRECPFHCLMCDLWQHTTEQTVPVGAIPAQIAFALRILTPELRTPARHIKLYNSGNFFDPKAIPVADHAAIAAACAGFKTVIVENHPTLTGPRCLPFRDLLAARGIELQIAMGLETIHPEVLPRLNKQMTVEDFANATRFLTSEGIRTRAFILLRHPFLSEDEGVHWALRSIDFAFEVGVECCSIIPTRGGNGIMEQLGASGLYAPPVLASLESVQEFGLSLNRGRLFVDLWDAQQFATCSVCVKERIKRLQRVNLSQCIEARVTCEACAS